MDNIIAFKETLAFIICPTNIYVGQCKDKMIYYFLEWTKIYISRSKSLF